MYLYIRNYERKDFQHVWDLHVLALKQVGVYLGNGVWDEDLQKIEDVYQNGKGAFLVGEIDREIIAMGAIRKFDKETAEIKRMRTHPDFQGKGYGTLILTELEKRAKKLGYKKLYLRTAEKQIGAQKFYEKNGFLFQNKDIYDLPDSTSYKDKTICEFVYRKRI